MPTCTEAMEPLQLLHCQIHHKPAAAGIMGEDGIGGVIGSISEFRLRHRMGAELCPQTLGAVHPYTRLRGVHEHAPVEALVPLFRGSTKA